MEVQMAESHQPTTAATGSSPTSPSPASSAGSSQHDKGSSAESGGGAGERANVAGTLSDLKDRVASAQQVVKTKYRLVSESTDDYVHESPWKAVTMALIGGLIIGMLARR
jgi:ElaB protein